MGKAMDGTYSNAFVLPDLDGMKATKKSLRVLVSRETEALGRATREQLHGLLQMIEDCEDFVIEEVMRSLIQLNNMQPWDEVEVELQRIGADPHLAPEQRTAMGQAFQQDLEQEGQRTLFDLRQQCDAFQLKFQALARYRIGALAEQAQPLKAELGALTTSLAQTRLQLAKQVKAREDLDLVINAFADPSLSRQFKNLIPTEVMIEQARKLLNLSDVDIDALKCVAKVLEEHIDLVAEGRKYASVVAARDRLRREIQVRQAELQRFEARQAELSEELGQLAQVDRADQLRAQWLSEAVKVPAGLSQLLEGFGQRLTLMTQSEGLAQVASYFGAIRQRYEDL